MKKTTSGIWMILLFAFVLLATSSFSKEAIDFASRVDSKIILIDGDTLVQHMIDHNVGVTPFTNYEIKKIDLDYFT